MWLLLLLPAAAGAVGEERVLLHELRIAGGVVAAVADWLGPGLACTAAAEASAACTCGMQGQGRQLAGAGTGQLGARILTVLMLQHAACPHPHAIAYRV